MTRFTDAALLKGSYAHMAAEFRAGNRVAPRARDWSKAAADSPAELAALDVGKHIFALQQQIDAETTRIEIVAHSNVGQMKVLGLVPGDGDLVRVDGIFADGSPVAHLVHVSQLALTFVTAPLNEEAEDDGLNIGFLIFDELKARKKNRTKKAKKLSLSTSRTIKPKSPKKTTTGQSSKQ